MLSHPVFPAILALLINLLLFQSMASDQSTLLKRTPASDPTLNPGGNNGGGNTGSSDTIDGFTITAHCGNEWGSYHTNDKKSTSCRDYSNKNLNCRIDSCHVGLQKDTPQSHPVLQKMYFQNCTELGNPDTKPVVVYALSYLAKNREGNLNAYGFPLGSLSEEVRHYKCPWYHREDFNNKQRVWCDKCARQ